MASATFVTHGEETKYVESVVAKARALKASVRSEYRQGLWTVLGETGQPGFYDRSTPEGEEHFKRYGIYQDFDSWFADLELHKKEWDDHSGAWVVLSPALEYRKVKEYAVKTAKFDTQLQEWRAVLLSRDIVVDPPKTSDVERPPGIFDLLGEATSSLPSAEGSSFFSIKNVAILALIGVGGYYAISTLGVLGGGLGGLKKILAR